MKKFLFLSVIALGAMAVTAQNVGGRSSYSGSSFFSTEKTDRGITFGIRGGLNVAGLSNEFIKGYGEDYSFKNAIGFNAGINIDIPVVKSFYVQTGVYFTSKNAKIEEFWYDKAYGVSNYKLNPMYVEIPLLASYRYNFNDKAQLQVNLGPYFAYGVAGESKYEGKKANLFTNTSENLEKYIDKNEKLLKPFDAGISVGLGFTLSHFFVGVKYEKGFTNICNAKGWYHNSGTNFKAVDIEGLKSIKTHNFSVNVGYDF